MAFLSLWKDLFKQYYLHWLHTNFEDVLHCSWFTQITIDIKVFFCEFPRSKPKWWVICQKVIVNTRDEASLVSSCCWSFTLGLKAIPSFFHGKESRKTDVATIKQAYVFDVACLWLSGYFQLARAGCFDRLQVISSILGHKRWCNVVRGF